ncbi:DUF7739 domain-containing protein [Streptomyces venezuelae]|uniref:DUF7739 domain-containing protein n=1 Tax=Streptomyces venezuelae TaxID=54571 RepID=A0A5P2B5S9_STRVZ|nr:hypothetical protein [Streptomyces venezuelae]QES25843.1 hypothetical protein DEJ47_04690 [Streptomyces venezuelae]
MGFSISHGVAGTRSALTISNLGNQLAHVLAANEWREIKYLFGGQFSDIVTIPPQEAFRIGDLLHQAADHRLMDPSWGILAREIGDAARMAGASGQNWTWS